MNPAQNQGVKHSRSTSPAKKGSKQERNASTKRQRTRRAGSSDLDPASVPPPEDAEEAEEDGDEDESKEMPNPEEVADEDQPAEQGNLAQDLLTAHDMGVNADGGAAQIQDPSPATEYWYANPATGSWERRTYAEHPVDGLVNYGPYNEPGGFGLHQFMHPAPAVAESSETHAVDTATPSAHASGPMGPMGPEAPVDLSEHKSAGYVNENPDATPEENAVGEFLNDMAQSDLLGGVKSVKGAPIAKAKGVRSGDYRFTMDDGRVVPADLLEMSTDKPANGAQAIANKFDQADTVVVKLSDNVANKRFASDVITALKAFPGSVRPRRVLFLVMNQGSLNVFHDHTFPDASPMKWSS